MARAGSVAVVGADGRIYAFGGYSQDLTLSSAEVYDPRTNHWTLIAGMPHERWQGFVGGVAGDGHVYVTGGFVSPPGSNGGGSCGAPSPVEAYDPLHNAWKTVGSTLNCRYALAAATGLDGRVYAVGGAGDGNGRMLEVLPPR